MTYAEYCAEKCEWCAKGVTYGYATTNGIYHKFQGVQYLCTAPSRDQFEQELQERIAELEGSVDEWKADYKAVVADMDRYLGRIAELERQNDELRKDKARLDWLLQRQREVCGFLVHGCVDKLRNIRKAGEQK